MWRFQEINTFPRQGWHSTQISSQLDDLSLSHTQIYIDLQRSRLFYHIWEHSTPHHQQREDSNNTKKFYLYRSVLKSSKKMQSWDKEELRFDKLIFLYHFAPADELNSTQPQLVSWGHASWRFPTNVCLWLYSTSWSGKLKCEQL